MILFDEQLLHSLTLLSHFLFKLHDYKMRARLYAQVWTLALATSLLTLSCKLGKLFLVGVFELGDAIS